MKKIINKIKENPFKYIFYSIGIIFILTFFMAIILSQGEVIKKYIHAYPQDHFQDFFNSMWDTLGRHPYQNKVIYPPLCYLIYYVFLRFIPIDQIYSANSMTLRLFQGPMFSFMIYTLVTFLIYVFLVKKLKKGTSLEKNIFLVLITFSLPFIFEFERANIIFLSLLLLIFFFVYKDSNNKILKELALISLAASAAIKIYPAIFGLILIKEKRWKEIIRVIIYGLILFLVPFIFFGGFEMIIQFYKNITSTSAQFTEQIFMHKLSFASYSEFLIRTFNLKGELVHIIFKFIYIILIITSCISSYITKVEWKRILILTLLMIIVPNISFTYTAIFLIIPIAMALDENKKKSKIDYIYLILFILIMFPNPIALFEKGDIIHFIKQLSWNSIIMSTSIMLMTILLNIDIIGRRILKK